MRMTSSEQSTTSVYLGGEKPLLDPEIERVGVEKILQSLTEEETVRLTDPSMPIRHLRAEKGDVAKAVEKLKLALKWREEFGTDKIVKALSTKDAHEFRELLARENKTGKMYIRGYDKNGRAMVIMRPAMENTKGETEQMKHLVWNLEKAIACTRRKSKELGAKVPLEKVNLIIDYEGFTLSHAPPLSTSRYTLEILQNHYPERMNHIFVLNPPFVFKAFWSLVRNFVDPVTKEKLVFCSGKKGMEKLISQIHETDTVEPAYGGCSDKEFDSMAYLNLPFHFAFDEPLGEQRPALVAKTLGSGSFLVK